MELIKSKKVSGKKFNKFFLDIGTPKNLIYAKRKLISYLNRPAVFLDRDGTINEDLGYTHQIKDLKFRKGVIDGLQILQKKNFQLFIITNQAGIGRGIYTENDFFNFYITCHLVS